MTLSVTSQELEVPLIDEQLLFRATHKLYKLDNKCCWWKKGNFKATSSVTLSANGPFLNKHEIKLNFLRVSITTTVNVVVVNVVMLLKF